MTVIWFNNYVRKRRRRSSKYWVKYRNMGHSKISFLSGSPSSTYHTLQTRQKSGRTAKASDSNYRKPRVTKIFLHVFFAYSSCPPNRNPHGSHVPVLSHPMRPTWVEMKRGELRYVRARNLDVEQWGLLTRVNRTQSVGEANQ